MKLMILDGNSLANRAYYGVRLLNAPDGTPTNAVYGFLSILQKLLSEHKPESLCVAFDVHAPTFRHEMFDGYKAQRKPMPEELRVQMPMIKELLDVMGIRRYELAGWEADDLLGSAGAMSEKEGWDCLIVTGDKDSFQLITDTTHVLHVKTAMGQTTTREYTPEVFYDEYGFSPVHIVDLKALMGDASDNIPGVAGVGEKTAMDLIQRYTTVAAVYDNLDTIDVKPAVRTKLAAGRESAFLSYELATIRRDAPIEIRPEAARFELHPSGELYDFLRRLGFNKFIEKWKLTPSEERSEEAALLPQSELNDGAQISAFIEKMKGTEYVAVFAAGELDEIELCDGERVYRSSRGAAGEGYNALLGGVFSPDVRKISHNVKDLMTQLLREGLSIEGFIFDTALGGYLLEATQSDYAPERLSARYCGREMHGAQAVFALYAPLEAKIRELGMRKLMFEIELPLCAVLAEMETRGFLVDRKALFEYGEALSVGIEALQRSIFELVGHEFNINSPKQLGTVLFDELMLPLGKKTKTGWSTNAEVLEKLRGKHEVIEQILDYRMLTKLKSTYADGLLKVICADGRIHTSFRMTVTATGRLSSTEPNLQNIPIRKELGSEIRKMFVAAPGMVLVDADYSQIELRLLAHISADEVMREAFLSGEDFHAATAARVFNVPLENVTPILRSRAKAVNFGVVYGISAWSLAGDIGVSQSEAKSYMDAYFDKFRGVHKYMEDIVEKAKADGFVTTLFGRRRDLPELRASNFAQRAFGERVALNMPIQGTAADIIKLAMVNVDRRLRAEGLSGRLVLQVHDELIAECPETECEAVMRVLEQEMENAVHLAVPLLAQAKYGRSWASAH